MKKLLIGLICGFCLAGCNSNNDNSEELITYIEAKEKIINESAILVDVRTQSEYNDKHIDGAVLLPLDEINEDSVLDVFESEDVEIIVYCKSGNRSSQAVDKLKSLGYENVYDLGSISNWEE